jgi:hypothetical protein
MEAMLGISLYSYLYLKLAKTCLSYYLLCFLFNKIGEEGRIGSAWKQGRKERERWPQTMYTHMSKCIKNKKRRRMREGVNSSMTYLIYLKTFLNATMYLQHNNKKKKETEIPFGKALIKFSRVDRSTYSPE